MAGKHDTTTTTEPSWRPLQKLSGFITKHSSAKGKKSPEATDEKASVFKFKRQKKTSSSDNAPEFEPLEVDLDMVEAFRLSEGWLEKTQTGNTNNDREQQRRPEAPDNSVTPIADQFVSKSVLDVSNSTPLGRSSSENYSRRGSRPFSMIEPGPPADLSSIYDAPSAGSILDRGRPVESRRYVTDPLPKTKGLRELTSQDGTTNGDETIATSKYAPLKPRPSDAGRSLTTKPGVSSELRPPKNVDPSNRHSMYAGATPSLSSVTARTRTAQSTSSSSSRSASATPLDRIQTWQKSVTSAPTSAASSSTSSLTLGGGVPSQAAAPAATRRVAGRGGVMGNRLAWIRELEEKKSNGNVNRDLPVLKKQAGSVSDKLAMFESKQGRAASPASRLPPLARSNSTTSRLSSVGLESASSAYGGDAAATPRTSLDTVRSSHRASSVMSYYDDTFREKMESIVIATADKDKSDDGKDKSDDGKAESNDKDKPEESQEKQRVTAQFVPVKVEKPEEVKEEAEQVEEDPQTRQLEAGPSIKEAENEVKEVQSPQPEAGPSPHAEPEKGEEDFQPVQSDEGTENVTNNEA